MVLYLYICLCIQTINSISNDICKLLLFNGKCLFNFVNHWSQDRQTCIINTQKKETTTTFYDVWIKRTSAFLLHLIRSNKCTCTMNARHVKITVLFCSICPNLQKNYKKKNSCQLHCIHFNFTALIWSQI